MHTSILLILGLTACAESCTPVQPGTEPDWANMNKDWYDVLNMPSTTSTAVDCYHWLNMTGTADGFNVDLTVSKGGYPSQSYSDHFVRKNTGVYEMSGEYVGDFIRTVIAANAHRENKEIQVLAATGAAWMARVHIALLTDNHNYMIFSMCSEWGPINWVKFPSTTPSISQIVAAWNALVENGLMGTVHYNEICRGK